MAQGTTLDFDNSYTLTNAITVSGDPTVNVNAGLTETLAGAIGDGSAPGDVVKTGVGNLILSAPNTYTGATTISGGTLSLMGAGAIAASSGVTDNGTFDISAAGADASIRSLSGTGGVTLGARSLTLTAASSNFGGTIAGSGGMTLASGHEILSGINTYGGNTTILGGELQVDGSLINSAVTVATGGTLSGIGSVAGLMANAGSKIEPGGAKLGTLTVNGPFSQASGSAYEVQLAGGGSTSDLIAVTGKATLASGAILDVVAPTGGTLSLTARYTVLSATGGVTGRYTLAGDGDTAISAFYTLVATYDANDVYLGAQQTRDFADAAVTPNQTATALALNSIAATSALRAAVGLLPSDVAARAAFDQLSGEIHSSAKTALLEQSNVPRDAATDRLREAFCGVGAGNTAFRAASADAQTSNNACNPAMGPYGHAPSAHGATSAATAMRRASTLQSAACCSAPTPLCPTTGV